MTKPADEDRHDLDPEEYEHPLGYLFKRGPKSYRTRRLIRSFLNQDGKCYYCHQDMDPYYADDNPMSFSIDHVIPLLRGGGGSGGGNSQQNTVACCVGCNQVKGCMTLEEFTEALILAAAVMWPSIIVR